MRIVVVGGVAGGMSAAARARRLDETAEIVVLERGPYPSFANCGLPYYVGGEIADADRLLVQTPASLREALALDVRPGHEAVGLDAVARTVTVRSSGGTYELGYDALDLGPLAEGWRIQRDTPAYGTQYAVDPADWSKGAKPASADEVGTLAAQAKRYRDS